MNTEQLKKANEITASIDIINSHKKVLKDILELEKNNHKIKISVSSCNSHRELVTINASDVINNELYKLSKEEKKLNRDFKNL